MPEFAIAPVLRVVPPAIHEERLQKQAALEFTAREEAKYVPSYDSLAAYIRKQYDAFKNHRNSAAGWSERLLAAQRTFNGHYDNTKLAEIRRFGGSEVYARITAMKCRGATALLRDIYLAPDRPWGIRPPADPDIPVNIIRAITQLVEMEIQNLQQAGGLPPDAAMIRDRTMQLMDAARGGAKKQASKRARLVQDKIEEILDEGGFYNALAEFIVDIPQFPYACIKGPTVRIVPTVSWDQSNTRGVFNNQLPLPPAPPAPPDAANPIPGVRQVPRMMWQRVSPFDLYWSPGVSDIGDATMIERTRLTRAELNDLLDLPGFNHAAIRGVLDDYGRGGLFDNWDSTDSERALNESRENPLWNQTGIINCLEFHGNVQGRMLLEPGYGFTLQSIPDPLRDYMVQCWIIGSYVIKVQLSPTPRRRHPYYISSFEKIPGTPVGNGLPDILSDIQDVANATLRSLVNNLSIASGPQVVINKDRAAPGADMEDLYPWKRWYMNSDPFGNNQVPPVNFFQPNSNARDLLQIYQFFSTLADDLSAIPKYITGQGAPGGAGRTASGLSMLMSNASKILQTVAANVDRDVMSPALTDVYDLLMLTDTTGLLHGDETIKVMGVNVAIQRETQRARQIEFLTATANPLDAQIMGAKGRAAVLRSVSQTIGLDGEEIVPNEDQIAKMQKAQDQAPAPPQPSEEEQHKAGITPPSAARPGAIPTNAAAARAQGGQRQITTGDAGPRTNLMQQRPGAPRINGGVG